MSQLETNTISLEEILDAVNALPEAGSGEPVLQEKTVTPTTSQQSVTPDTGYDGLSKVTVNAMPTATQATPSISVSSAGLITSSATQSAGYVAAGTKSATKQLDVQAAQTITPGTSDQTIASGKYLTGAQTIKGDANLVAGNIKSGVSIFGVAGTLTEGEDVTEETDEYTDLLTELETAVDALPDAGSGGSVDTCTVRPYLINGSYYGDSSVYFATIYENGVFQTVTGDWNTSTSPIQNVVCGSMFCLKYGCSADLSTFIGAELIYGSGMSAFSITGAAGTDVQILCSNDK